MPASPETASYRLNHTMFRIKDPVKSLHFYQEILGMDLIDEHDGGDFKLFFLAYGHQKVPRGEREGILELTWNKGTESKPEFSYHNGNDQPQGFGHIAIAVDDVQQCQDRLLAAGVEFKKKLEDGRMRHIAFAYDPDRYWIEIVPTQRKDV
ncbi:Lactoylglutathione lyase [Thoreauomyces humboldtii]|nr:Lactoylglutathione lyase [Thoreauomyces humboldtii]